MAGLGAAVWLLFLHMFVPPYSWILEYILFPYVFTQAPAPSGLVLSTESTLARFVPTREQAAVQPVAGEFE